MKQFKQLLASNGNLNTNILVRAYLSNPDESPEYAVALIDALVNQVRDLNKLLEQKHLREPMRVEVSPKVYKEIQENTTGNGIEWATKPANPVFYDEIEQFSVSRNDLIADEFKPVIAPIFPVNLESLPGDDDD